MTAVLTPDLASRFARLTLEHVEREYPNLLAHRFDGPDDARTPRALHPIFFGSFDWHSCVLGYWVLARVLRRFPALPEAAPIRALFERRFTADAVAGELAYLQARPNFERPYGWGWMLRLQSELLRHEAAWAAMLQPLAEFFVCGFLTFLPKAAYPVRVGTHFNTALALVHALDYAAEAGDEAVAAVLREKARSWYARDADCQAWEPSGDDFLSSALIEAACMRRVLPAEEFSTWRDAFLPRLGSGEPATLFSPVVVSDRSDGKLAHLDGLNLSRAWCWRGLAMTFRENDPRRALTLRAAERHLAASLPHIEDDYMVSHWAAAYAVLALDAG